LRIEGKLKINSGKILNFTEGPDGIDVAYFDKKAHAEKTLKVSRIINCTGPETDLNNVSQSFLKNCLLKGILTQDSLKLGIKTNTDTYQVIDAQGNPHKNLFTLGGNLKGELWESTAVNELKTQTENLAELLKVHSNTSVSQISNV
jgi:uncharacterized NAD(P)/FAD-binding protein YdhS